MICAIVCALLGAAPDGGPTPLREKLKYDVPGAIDEVEVPGMMQASGTPLRMRAVRSRLSLDALAEHFTAAFERDGLFIPPPGAVEGPGPHVTGYDPEKGIAYTALFQTNSDKSVTVILSEVYLHARKVEAPFVPVFPGASAPLDSKMEGARALQYTAPAHAKEIEAFYRDVMRRAGCREAEPLAFVCGRKLNRVWVRERPDRPASVVVQQTDSASE